MSERKQVGYWFNSYGFIRAYHQDWDKGIVTQIGSIGASADLEQIREFDKAVCAAIEKRSGKPTFGGFGTYYQEADQPNVDEAIKDAFKEL